MDIPELEHDPVIGNVDGPIMPGPDHIDTIAVGGGGYGEGAEPEPTTNGGSLSTFVEGVGEVAVIDTDGNGDPDTVVIDTNSDGSVDLTATPNSDGTWHLSWDSDGDGSLDSAADLTGAEIQAQWPELYGILGDPVIPDGDGEDRGNDQGPAPVDPTTPTVTDGQMIGDPQEWSKDWFLQSFNGSCLPASLAQIYSEYTGEQVTDQDIMQIVNQQHGWIIGVDDNGQPTIGVDPDAADDILKSIGIDAYSHHGNLADLEAALSEGKGVMVTVDSGEIWDPAAEPNEDNTIDHALLVTGIGPGLDANGDTILDGNGDPAQFVYLSDTGTDTGNMEAVPIDQFEGAWADGGNYMVECDQSVTEFQASHPDQVAQPDDRQEGDGQPQQETGADDANPTPTVDPLGGTGLDLGHSFERPQDDAVTELVQHPWIILPILIGAAAIVRNVTKK
jgi:hypothetical protein